MGAARIGRVRMKGGGADLHILRNPEPETNWRGLIVGHARLIASHETEDLKLSGFLVVGMFSDGTTSTGCRYDPKAPGVIPRALLPAYVAEIVRREMVTAPEAEDVACAVVNRSNGYDDE